MAWRECAVEVRREHLKLASAALLQAGAAGLQEDFREGEAPPPRQPWDSGPDAPLPPIMVLKAWFEDADPAAVEAAIAPWRIQAAWTEVPDTNWDTSWQAGFEPIVISERLVIAPPWNAPEGALIIEPGQGFGTGYHETTRAMLEVLDQLADDVQSVLDVGCGSGILALAATHLGCTARGIDIDDDAIRDAHLQAEANGMRVPFSTTPVHQCDPADLVFANLFAEALIPMHEELIRCTGQWLALAGVLASKEDMVREAFDPALRMHQRMVDGEWVALLYQVHR